MTGSGPFTIQNLILNGRQDPDQNAIESPGHHPLTYRSLRAQICRVVSSLNSLGFHRNDRIAVIMPGGPETAVVIIAVMAGFTVVPLNPQYRDQEFDRYFSRMAVKAVILQNGHDSAARSIARSRGIPVIELIPRAGFAGMFDLDPDKGRDTGGTEFATPTDTAILLLTSGSTGTEKTVPLSQEQFLSAKQRIRTASGITGGDRALHLLPYYHAMGLSSPLLVILIAGGTVICTRDFIPPDFLPLLGTFHPTYYDAGPALNQAILRELKKAPANHLKNTSLRAILTGSASRSETTNRELQELLGVVIIEGYASSETGMIAVNNPPRAGAVGLPIIESLRIVDEDGMTLPAGEAGEIIVRGETVFSGYENAPEDNRAVFTEGWFHTGDLGYLDPEGYLFLTGRKKELINKGGEKISPAEIDTVLRSHPGVEDAMAFAVPDPVLGEEVAALVVLADHGVTRDELHRFLLDRLAPFKVPRMFHFVRDLPRTPSGKPRRDAASRIYAGTADQRQRKSPANP